jgi:hypothetical protein
VKYKLYEVEPFEREPGKWRASIRRSDGESLTVQGTTLPYFTVSADYPTSEQAIQEATAAIDGGLFA